MLIVELKFFFLKLYVTSFHNFFSVIFILIGGLHFSVSFVKQYTTAYHNTPCDNWTTRVNGNSMTMHTNV